IAASVGTLNKKVNVVVVVEANIVYGHMLPPKFVEYIILFVVYFIAIRLSIAYNLVAVQR
ncbi:MAG: hypothetical protein Q4A05_11090, partial [Ruminococcus sp.]|nr:hypothetical protein [Ruminococcus sp.]